MREDLHLRLVILAKKRRTTIEKVLNKALEVGLHMLENEPERDRGG